MYLKLALGNVRRSVKDYSVFFATLAFAACLLYSFIAAGDYLAAMALTDAQRSVLASQQLGTVMGACSGFVVVVFAFLVAYGFRFILRRRKREFATYMLLGMDAPRVSRVLRWEGTLVGVASFAAGIVAAMVLSPLFMALEAFVFNVRWALAFVVSADALAWTAVPFALLVAFGCLASGRTVSRATLAKLLSADRRPEHLVGASRPWAVRLQLVGGIVLMALVWASVLLQPGLFLALMLPFALMALMGTYLLFRVAAQKVPEKIRRRPRRYLDGLTAFAVRQVEAKASSSALAMAMVCVLLACGICMAVGGLCFSVGLRSGVDPAAGTVDPLNWAPVGFVGLCYGVTFIVAAMAVLALQQLSEAADSAGRYRTLSELGAPDAMVARSLMIQLVVYFGVPLGAALVHDVVGLTLVALLAEGCGAAGFAAIAASTVVLTVAIMGVYLAITYFECRRVAGLTSASGRGRFARGAAAA